MFAPVGSSYDISPYGKCEIFRYGSEQLEKWGFKFYKFPKEIDPELVSKLAGTVENIKAFFWERFQCVGIDRKGAIPPFLLDLVKNNAFYFPPIHGFYCGAVALNNIFTWTPEVVAHEFTHGVVQHLNPLGNAGKAGAINEAIADVVGIVFKRSILAIKDWKIRGTDRDLSKLFTWKMLKTTEVIPRIEELGQKGNDNGNVHYNSQLMSHAFFLASTNLAKSNADAGNKMLLATWFGAVCELKDDEKTFKGFAQKTVAFARTAFNNRIAEEIDKAWAEVGMNI